MAKIERKLKDVKNTVGNILTNYQWIVEIEADGTNALVTDDVKKFKWRVESVGGIALPEVPIIDVKSNGFTIPFFGQVDKRGEITLNNVVEDDKGTVATFARKLMKYYHKGSDSATSAVDSENVATKSANEMRFKVTVKLGDVTGNVVRTWRYFNALMTVENAVDLGQEAAPVYFNFKVAYTTFTDADKDSGTSW